MNRIIIGAALLAMPLAACGSAIAATRSYGLTSFARLRVTGPFDVHVRVGGSPSARATGPQEALDRLSIEQNGDTLVIKPLSGGGGGWSQGNIGKVVIEVSAPALSQIALSGSGDVDVDRVRGDTLDLALTGSGDLGVGAIEVGRLAATMTGSGDLSVAGHARTATATLTGPGSLKGGDLVADDVETRLIGSGDIALGARHAAKVSLAGSGDVTITGPAACTVNRTGSGDVHCGRQAGN